MKKTTIILLLFCYCCGYAQLAQESFEGTWSPVPAASGTSSDWLILDNGIGIANSWVQQAHTDLIPSFEGTPGTHAAYIQRENVATGLVAADYLVTPEFILPSGGELRFFSRLTFPDVQGSIYKVMILPSNQLANAANIGSYVAVEEWTEDQINTEQQVYTEVNVPFDPVYHGTTVRIAFVMEGDFMDRWLIDNVSVTFPCHEASGLGAGEIGLTSAGLTWLNPYGFDAWEIEIVLQGDAPSGNGVVYNGAPPYLATQMTDGTAFLPGTDYKFYVKALCGNGVSSDWVGAFSFSTQAYGENCEAPLAITALPYYDAGDTAGSADMYNGVAGTGCGISTTDEYLEGNDVVYHYTAGFTGAIDIERIGNEGYSGIFIYDECANIGVNCLDGGISDSLGAPVYLDAFPVTAGEDYYIVVSSSTLNLTTPYALLVQQVTCMEPVALAPGSIGMTSAELNWTNPTGASSWEMAVQQPGEGVPPGSGTSVASNTNVAVVQTFNGTDLMAGTTYEYWVRADCGNGTFSSWAGPYTFKTSLCEVSGQCTHTFTMWALSNSFWFGATMSVIQNNEVVATLTGPPATGTGPVTQTVQLCDGMPYQLFWNNNGTIPSAVGISAANEWGQVYFTKDPGQGSPNTTLYATTALDCDIPLCLAPTGLGIANSNAGSVDLLWEGNAAGSWEYYIVPSGDPAPNGSSAGMVTNANPAVGASQTADGAGLQPSSAYQFYVRQLCSDAVTAESSWSGPFAFQTAACNVSDQCGYTFIMSGMWSSGWLGGTMAVKQNGQTVMVLGPTFTSGATLSVTVPLCDDVPFEVHWLTGGSWASQMGLKIMNSYGQEVYNLPYFSAGLGTTIFTGANDCDHPACIQPAGLYTENNTVNSVDLGWEGVATGNWEYYVVEEGQPAPGASVPGTATTSNPTVGVALPTPGTNYEFYVRLACQGGTFTDWSGPHDFYSQACADEDKCVYVFELLSENGYGWEGNTMTVFQNGVPVATLGQTPFTGYSHTEQVALCPDTEISIYWEYTGDTYYDKGLVVYTPWMYDIYTLEYNTQFQGTTLFTGAITCDPPLCFKPTGLSVENVSTAQATFSWEPGATETEWAVWIVPGGAGEPVPDSTPTFTTTENPVIYGNDPGEILDPATVYEFYVMALCGGDAGSSILSDPEIFVTGILNDDCTDAIEIPVNPGVECNVFASGSLTSATASGLLPTCAEGNLPTHDAWFYFNATSGSHSITIDNTYGNLDSTFTIYEGNCSEGLTEVFCSHTEETYFDGFTPGNTYLVMVTSIWVGEYPPYNSFDICIRVPQGAVYVSETDYTVPELVRDIFIGTDCAYIDNIVWSSGEEAGKNGIAYFSQNGTAFPFESGIVLVSGDAEDDVPGPNDEGAFLGGWNNDEVETPLENILGVFPGTMYGGSSIKFDFSPMQDIPVSSTLFRFIFASNEYSIPSYECYFADLFAFILTDLETGESVNLAVLPTGEPIMVTTVHPENEICSAYNEEFFGYYNPLLSPINLNGQTIPMDAILPYALEANHQYSMQMVVANQGDDLFSSAVFLLEGSMNLGAVPLGADLTVEAGTALCQGETVTIQSNLDPGLHTFLWYQDGEVIEGETAPNLVVDEPGTYLLNAPATGTECIRDGQIEVEFFPVIGDITTAPQTLTGCGNDGFAQFDLESNTPVILNGLNAADYVVTYHASEEEAQDDENALTSPYTNTTAWQQPVWVRIENTVTGCHGFQESFMLKVTQLELSDDITICEGDTAILTAEVIAGQGTPVYAWTHDGEPHGGNAASAEAAEAGMYVVTVDSGGCTLTASVTVTISPLPVIDMPGDVSACDFYTLPALENGSYFTAPQGNGTGLEAGHVIEASQTLYVFAESGSMPRCTNEHSFTVTIVGTPVIDSPGDQVACGEYILPDLAAGNYYTGPGGSGIMLDEGEAIVATQDIYIYAATASTPPCIAEDMFTVTIIAMPNAVEMDNVTACVSYALPALDPGNDYFTEPNGQGEMLIGGDIIASTQTIYIYAQTATEPNCTDESSFVVTIVPLPEFSLGGPYTACDASDITIAVSAVNFDPVAATFAWLVNGEPSAETGSSIQATEFGAYQVTVTASGCETTVSVDVLQSIVTLAVGISQDCIDNVYSLTAADVSGSFDPDAVMYSWVGPEGFTAMTRSISPDAPGLYEVTATTPENCTGAASFEAVSTQCNIQRGISPNNDGDNDYFDLSQLDVRQLTIFNRYGQQVYSRAGYSSQWYGQSDGGGELPAGTYFYTVQRRNGENITGWIYINRE